MADSASRGLFPRHLNASNCFFGPPWLLSNYDIPPNVLPSTSISKDSVLQDQERHCFVVETTHFPEFLLKYLSYLKLVRIVTWIFTFCNDSKSLKLIGLLESQETAYVKWRIVKIIQAAEFSDDIRQLIKRKSVKSISKLSPLNIFFKLWQHFACWRSIK